MSDAEMILFSQKGELLVVRSSLTLRNLIITNDVMILNENKRFLYLWDIQARKIKLDTVYIQFYGKVIRALSHLNLEMRNTIVQTDWINEGILLTVDCSLLKANSYSGSMILTNYTQRGQRNLVTQSPLLQIQTLYNLTVDNCYFSSFTQFDDGSKVVAQFDSTNLCPFTADGLTKTLQISNLYFTSEANHTRSAVQFSANLAQRSDNGRRTQITTYENITFEHLYSLLTVQSISCGSGICRPKNITHNNVSTDAGQQFHLSLSGSGVLELSQLNFLNSYTEARVMFIVISFQNVTVDGFQVKNVKLDKNRNSNCILKPAGLPQTANLTLVNLFFFNNSIGYNQFIQQDQQIRKLAIINSTFQNEKLNSQTSYIANYKSYTFQILNTIFNNFSYSDDLKSGTFVIRYDEFTILSNLSEGSKISNVTFTQSDVNFLLFKGFRNLSTTRLNSREEYYLDISESYFDNNRFTKSAQIIVFDQYQDQNRATPRILNSFFRNNIFLAGGALIQDSHVSTRAITIRNCSFSRNYQGQIVLSPPDTQDVDFSLTLQVRTSNFSENLPYIDALFRVQTNSILMINDSFFDNTYSMSRGSVILADYQYAQVYVRNTSFRQNFAIDGGIFFAHYNSRLEFDLCNFTQNYAIQGSIGRIENQASFLIKNSYLQDNHATRSSILSILDSIDETSIFSNCTFENNSAYNLDALYAVMPSLIVGMLQSNKDIVLYETNSKTSYAMSISKGNLLICNGTILKNPKTYINAYSGTVRMSNVIIQNVYIRDIDNSLMSATSSTLILENITIYGADYQTRNIAHKQQLFTLFLNTTLVLNNFTILNGQIQLINAASSSIYIYNSMIDQSVLYNSQDRLIKLDSTKMLIQNTSLTNTNSLAGFVMDIFRSDNITISQSNFTNFNRNMFYIQLTKLNLIDSLFIIKNDFLQNLNQLSKRNNNRVIIALKESEVYIERSVLQNANALLKGGAVDMRNAPKLTLNGAIFLDNQASQGGAVSMACSKSTKCEYQIINSQFGNNRASVSGGCIIYNKQKPTYFNNTFDGSNYSPYGSSIAGYPFGLKVLSYDRKILASGQKYQGTIVVQVIDPEFNIINTDNNTLIKIDMYMSGTDVTGQYQIQVENGIGIFNDLKFKAPPGSQNITFQIYSSTINTQYLQSVFAKGYPDINPLEINKQLITFDFRDCISGEININNECVICPTGQYSFNPIENECNDCPKNSECSGGENITVNEGYWKSSFYSDNIIECLFQEACIGGNYDKNYNKSLAYYPLCAYGYGGNLCHNCQYIDGILFTRINSNECGFCPDKTENILKISGIFIALLVSLAVLLWINLRHQRESQTSVVIRILLNYIQVLATAAEYNLQWPVYMKQFFRIFQSVGQVAESFISFDCFLQDTGFTSKGSSTFYFKTLLISILPIVMTLLFVIFFLVWKFIRQTSRLEYKRQVIVSSIVTLFAIHPTITRLTTSLFFCMELDQGEFWLTSDLEIKCWSGQHIVWSLAIGIPSITIWIVGIPLLGFIYLFKNKHRHHDPKFFGRYRMIYQGLKEEYFFWEFINIIRKNFLVAVNVFLNLYSNIFKALLSLLVLNAFLRLQTRLQPYKNPVINTLEQREYFTSIITFFGALFFINSEISDQVQLIAFIVIILFNLWFILLWGYCLFNTIKYPVTQKMATFLKKLTVSKSLADLEETYFQERSIFLAQLEQKKNQKSMMQDQSNDYSNLKNNSTFNVNKTSSNQYTNNGAKTTMRMIGNQSQKTKITKKTRETEGATAIYNQSQLERKAKPKQNLIDVKAKGKQKSHKLDSISSLFQSKKDSSKLGIVHRFSQNESDFEDKKGLTFGKHQSAQPNYNQNASNVSEASSNSKQQQQYDLYYSQQKQDNRQTQNQPKREVNDGVDQFQFYPPQKEDKQKTKEIKASDESSNGPYNKDEWHKHSLYVNNYNQKYGPLVSQNYFNSKIYQTSTNYNDADVRSSSEVVIPNGWTQDQLNHQLKLNYEYLQKFHQYFKYTFKQYKNQRRIS